MADQELAALREKTQVLTEMHDTLVVLEKRFETICLVSEQKEAKSLASLYLNLKDLELKSLDVHLRNKTSIKHRDIHNRCALIFKRNRNMQKELVETIIMLLTS